MNPEAIPYFDMSALTAGMQPRDSVIVDERSQNALLKRLQHHYKCIKKEQRLQSDIYLPAGEWREHINMRMPHYQAFFDETTERLAELLQNFWRNELGVLVKQYAGYQQLQGDANKRIDYAERMAYDLMIWSNLIERDVAELSIPEVGHPWGYVWKGVLVGSKVLRYHLLANQVEGLFSDIERPVVAEIGAGYGGLAYFLMRGTENRVYIDFDLPETLVVSAYYLGMTLPHRRIYLHEEGPVDWSATLSNYDVILLPNWCIDTLPESTVDVFLNTFSLSEMSQPVIEKYLLRIAVACRNYFLHNNMDRIGVVNCGHLRTPGSQYPFPAGTFKLLSKHYDMFQELHSGRDGDYREFLYQRTSKAIDVARAA